MVERNSTSFDNGSLKGLRQVLEKLESWVPTAGRVLLLIFVAFLTVYPLLMIIYTSFYSGTPGFPGDLTLEGYVDVFGSSVTWGTLFASLWLSAVRAALSAILAVILAWIVARTDIPCRGTLQFLIMSRYLFPLVPFILAWMFLLRPQSGIINVWLMNLFHLDTAPFNIFSYGGIIWVSTLTYVPILFMVILPAFVRVDASTEEASRMCGASSFRTLCNITIPLVMPAIMGATMLGFIQFMQSFEAEALLGIQSGIFVFSTRIYWFIKQSQPPVYNSGMALCVMLLVIMAVLLVIQWRWVGSKQNKFTAISGRGYAVRPMKLGRWKYWAFGLVLFYFLLSTAIPAAMVVLGSFMQFAGLFVGDWFTFANWQHVFSDPHTLDYCLNTLILGLGSATAGSVLYFLISYVTVRTKFKGRAILDFLSWLPNIVPHIALALGLLWVWVGGLPFLPFSLYGTVLLLIVCLTTARIPYGVRIANGVMVQVTKELEEASRMNGATWLQTMWYVLIPLVWPGIVSTWLLTFIFAVKETVIVLMLYGVNSQTLSVRMFNLATQSGQGTHAMVIGVLETAIVMVVWIIFRFFSRRVGGQDMQVL